MYNIIKSSSVRMVENEPCKVGKVQKLNNNISSITSYLDESDIIMTCKEKAVSIIKAANEESQAIINSAKQEAFAIEEDAYNNGYSKGYDLAIKETKEKASNMFYDLESIIVNAKKLVDDSIDESKSDVIKLVVEIARKVINTEIDINTELFKHFINSTINQLKNKSITAIKVSEVDYLRLDNYCESLGESLPPGLTIDTNLGVNSCIVESKNGLFDVGIETQINEIENTFLLVNQS